MMGFIDQMRSEGHAVESIIRVLREQGVKIAARTYRAWRQGRVSVRTVTDAMVEGAVRDTAWRLETQRDGTTRLRMTPEGLYGRKKMTAFIRRTRIGDASRGAVDRAMRTLGLSGITRAKAPRTTIAAKDGVRAGDLLNRDFTAPRPDHTWVTDFTYVRTWAGWVYVAFILDVFSQRIVAWHAQTTKHVELVMIPLRMALWERDRDGRPVGPGQLIHHSDAGSQAVFNRSSQHRRDGVSDERVGQAEAGPGVSGADRVTWAAERRVEAGSRAVLGGDRGRKEDARGGRGCGCFGTCRAPVVPQRWWGEPTTSSHCVRSISVAIRAGGDRTVACARSWRARDRRTLGTGTIDDLT